jgi:DNA gyrase subunit A
MNVRDVSLRQESRDRYLTYALSVVTGRALPDVRDGLKPVQRRILYAMLKNLHLQPSSGHRKSAAVVGEVLARFHPHGDSACYEAMVRMAQTFSLRYPLVDGQGNFGSLDGDSAAAYRYTEAKLLPIALEVLGEIDEETVEFVDNFDATTQEPRVLPSRVPNLLINGATGIAVGMATSIPPHNLREIVKALVELSLDPEMPASKLTQFVKGPDFPTACLIANSKKEIAEIYQSGKGSICMRGDWRVEESARKKKFIVVHSLPYAINKAELVEKIADLIIARKVPQLVDIRDESTTDVRVVIELANDASPEAAMAYLYKHTTLESLFHVNCTALVPTGERGSLRPETLSLKLCLQHFLDFRSEVVDRRLRYERKNLLERIHILEGFVIIYDALDEAIKIVRKSNGRSDAAEGLRKRFELSELQAFAVVDMRIYQLSKTNIEEIRGELKERMKRVGEIDKTLKSKDRIREIVRKELEEISEKFGDARKSKIVKDDNEYEFNAADYVVREEVYAIVTRDGWLKRIRQNNELGSTRLREGDAIMRAHALSTLDAVAFVTNQGFLYTLEAKEFPASSGYGTPVQTILKFRDGEKIIESFPILLSAPAPLGQQSLLPSPSDGPGLRPGQALVLASQKGLGFSYVVESFEGMKRNGRRIMKLREGDTMIAALPQSKDLALFTRKGFGLVISSKEIPARPSAALGVSLMGVSADDALVGLAKNEKARPIRLRLSSGKEKELNHSEVPAGRRGLKGKRVVAKAEIEAVLSSDQTESGKGGKSE